MTALTAEESLRSNKTPTWIIYGLYAASFLVGITSYRLVIGAVKLNENQPIAEAKFGLAA